MYKSTFLLPDQANKFELWEAPLLKQNFDILGFAPITFAKREEETNGPKKGKEGRQELCG